MFAEKRLFIFRMKLGIYSLALHFFEFYGHLFNSFGFFCTNLWNKKYNPIRPMLLVTIILIILLSLALIKVIVKGKFFDCKIKTVEQFHDAIWNNAHEFNFF